MDCKIGDTVVYGGNGVCEIEDIRDIRYGRERPQKYYVLKPLFVRQSMTLFVPCNNEALTSKITPVISKDEAMGLIRDISEVSTEWIEDRNERKDVFSGKIASGDRRSIIEVIRTITAHKEELAKEGKTLNMQDEKFLTDALQRMNAEFAVALGMNVDQVLDFIRSQA